MRLFVCVVVTSCFGFIKRGVLWLSIFWMTEWLLWVGDGGGGTMGRVIEDANGAVVATTCELVGIDELDVLAVGIVVDSKRAFSIVSRLSKTLELRIAENFLSACVVAAVGNLYIRGLLIVSSFEFCCWSSSDPFV